VRGNFAGTRVAYPVPKHKLAATTAG